MSDQTEITHPLGWLAGQPGKPAGVLMDLALEMLSLRADLQEVAARMATMPSMQGAALEYQNRRINDLERYGVALPDWMKAA